VRPGDKRPAAPSVRRGDDQAAARKPEPRIDSGCPWPDSGGHGNSHARSRDQAGAKRNAVDKTARAEAGVVADRWNEQPLAGQSCGHHPGGAARWHALARRVLPWLRHQQGHRSADDRSPPVGLVRTPRHGVSIPGRLRGRSRARPCAARGRPAAPAPPLAMPQRFPSPAMNSRRRQGEQPHQFRHRRVSMSRDKRSPEGQPAGLIPCECRPASPPSPQVILGSFRLRLSLHLRHGQCRPVPTQPGPR
jgi:hypothetical protein